MKARVRYLRPEWKHRSERPQIGSRESRRANTAFYEVEIEDARCLEGADALSLERNGLSLVSHASAVRDFRDDALVREVYYTEWSERLRDLTGATRVFFLHHLIRTETPRDFNDAYARFVHCDFSDELAERLAHGAAREAGAEREEIRRSDYVLYNVWQPIERDVAQNPLALIDAATLDRADVVEYEYTASKTPGVASMPVYDPDHRFVYFPRMTTREAIVFTQLDPRPGSPYCCPHTSFDDPTAPPDAPGRRSIELRAVAAFEKARS